jgi:ABC-type transport system involved in multi-copper enzyme maturation permease subunit
VNPTLLVGLWRQRLASPIRLFILGLMIVLPPTFVGLLRGVDLSTLGDVAPLAMVFAVGMIGQDVSSGVLQLLLARPVRRWEYVVNRWLGVAIAASAASLLQIALGWAVIAMRGDAPAWAAVVQLAAAREFQIVGVAATMALLSSLVGGMGDLALYAVLTILGGVTGMIGQFRHSSLLVAIGQEVGALVSPRIELQAILAGSVSWFAIATWASNVTLCLLLAVLVMNRKELSYAST